MWEVRGREGEDGPVTAGFVLSTIPDIRSDPILRNFDPSCSECQAAIIKEEKGQGRLKTIKVCNYMYGPHWLMTLALEPYNQFIPQGLLISTISCSIY